MPETEKTAGEAFCLTKKRITPEERVVRLTVQILCLLFLLLQEMKSCRNDVISAVG